MKIKELHLTNFINAYNYISDLISKCKRLNIKCEFDVEAIIIKLDFNEVQPFILDEPPLKTIELERIEENTILSVPFKLWSFECREGLIDKNTRWIQEEKEIQLFCVIVDEITPGNYNFSISASNNEGIDSEIAIFSFSYKENCPILKEKYMWLKSFAKQVLNQIHHQKCGIVPCSIKKKYKHNREKKFYRCNEAIYVSKKSNKEFYDNECAIPINWNHSWRVMGHWRRLDNLESIGLDREGNRTVKGFTWINPFMKGDGKEVSKIRKIKMGEAAKVQENRFK